MNEKVFSLKTRSCPKHAESDLETICLHPSCNFQRMLCKSCYEDERYHLNLHKDSIINVSTIIDELNGLVRSDFYQNSLKGLELNQYLTQFKNIIDKRHKNAFNYLDHFLERVTNIIKSKKDELNRMLKE
jgi:hypothetical protein